MISSFYFLTILFNLLYIVVKIKGKELLFTLIIVTIYNVEKLIIKGTSRWIENIKNHG